MSAVEEMVVDFQKKIAELRKEAIEEFLSTVDLSVTMADVLATKGKFRVMQGNPMVEEFWFNGDVQLRFALKYDEKLHQFSYVISRLWQKVALEMLDKELGDSDE